MSVGVGAVGMAVLAGLQGRAAAPFAFRENLESGAFEDALRGNARSRANPSASSPVPAPLVGAEPVLPPAREPGAAEAAGKPSNSDRMPVNGDRHRGQQGLARQATPARVPGAPMEIGAQVQPRFRSPVQNESTIPIQSSPPPLRFGIAASPPFVPVQATAATNVSGELEVYVRVRDARVPDAGSIWLSLVRGVLEVLGRKLGKLVLNGRVVRDEAPPRSGPG